jgi:hypothetical protein
MVMNGAPEPAPSARVAAAEAEIAETRRRLDLALAAVRRELALPRAAVLAATAVLDRAGGAKELVPFIRRHAVPFGLMALGAAWLAMQGRAPREAGVPYARDLIDRARAIGSQAVEAALSAALDTAAPGAGGALPPSASAGDGATRPSGDDT